MPPIPDDAIQRQKHILMFGHESVLEAAALLRDRGGYDWWTLIVELDDGSYAAASFAALAEGVRERGEDLLQQPLTDLVGDVLQPVETVVERDTAILEEVRRAAAASQSKTAVVLASGEFAGVITGGATRSAGRGLFDAGLVELAGQYAELPEKGLLGSRRRRSKKKQSSDAASDVKDTSEPDAGGENGV